MTSSGAMWSAVAAKAAAAPAAAAPAAPAAASAALAAAPAAPAAPEVPAAAPQEATRPDQDAASGPEQEADEPPPSSLSGGRAEGLKALVVDTAALLQLDLRLDCLAPELYTVPEVLREVRSKQAREQLALVPYELHEREPSDAAMRFVTEFAKKTGDFAVLSAVDLRVLALTYMLEVELTRGASHLRQEPHKPRTVVGSGGVSVDAAALAAQQLEGFVFPKDDDEDEEGKPAAATGGADAGSSAAPAPAPEATAGASGSGSTDAAAAAPVPDDDDDEGWITPKNVAALRAKRRSGQAAAEADQHPSVVGCITADFAMQNVLMQIGLRVLGVDGKLIRQVRSYVLRCHACFKSTADMSKKFCPTCGNATLIRTSVSVDADGTLRYHLKANFQYRLRGTKYPIPEPKTGRHANNIILTEDQKEFSRRPQRSRKGRRMENAFDPDAAMAFSGTWSAPRNPTPPVGYGRRNPNETKGRQGRKKS